ncbi:hypothetical protein K8R33_00045 [archaeon]|nr:hypothetical protein [archaeon]
MTKERLVEDGKNGAFIVNDKVLDQRVAILRQSEERHFIANPNNKIERYYLNLAKSGWKWRIYSDSYIVDGVIDLIEKTPGLVESAHWGDNTLSKRYSPKKIPKWANGIYVALPPEPILICKGRIANDFTYRFMEIKEI